MESARNNKKAKKFIAELLELYKNHGISIAHEDGHGSFILEDNSQVNIDWIKNAKVDFKVRI